MRIGILTYHRSQNYGAQLQAYALQAYLQGLGYDVYIVDYWPDYHRDLYAPHHFSKQVYAHKCCFDKLIYCLRATILYVHSKIRMCKTNQFVCRYLKLSSEKKYDVLIYGSDQIWRKQHCEICPSYNPVYLGDDTFEADYRIAYAASMGKNEADEDDMQYLKMMLSKFSAVSVRESDLHDFIRDKLHVPVYLVSDPVLLLTKKQWQTILPKRRAHRVLYILVYNIAFCEQVNHIAKELSKKKNLPIIEFHGYIDKLRIGRKNVDTASARTFLHYLRDAEYVVTSSFHGVALSLCFQKQFYFATIDELANRTNSLLEKVHLAQRNLSINTELQLEECIRYDEVEEEIDEYIENSSCWINAQLKSLYKK